MTSLTWKSTVWKLENKTINCTLLMRDGVKQNLGSAAITVRGGGGFMLSITTILNIFIFKFLQVNIIDAFNRNYKIWRI